MDLFFVLKGLVNGERGATAELSGPANGPVLADGWYWLLDGDADPRGGPFDSREDAYEAATREGAE